MSRVQTLMVTEDDAGQRLDRWMRRHFPHVSQIQVEKICRKGEIRVDGGRVKTSTRLETGQAVRLPRVLSRCDPFSALGVPNSLIFDHPGSRPISSIHNCSGNRLGQSCCNCYCLW